MSVLVFGSLNMDLVTRTPRLPQPGETIAGHSFVTVPGGKGANQAIAVAKLGVPVQMHGRVGGDEFGKMLIESLRSAGVDCSGIQTDTCSSGVATIAIDDAGENNIVIIPGANGRVNESDVARLSFLDRKVLLLQLEIPVAIVLAAAQAAHQAGVTVILDPAPAPPELPAALYAAVDILTPNQVEAQQLTGIEVRDRDSAIAAAQELQRRGVKTVIIKMGAQGALCVTEEAELWIEPFEVVAIDTVAAGDAFNGGLAAALAEGRSIEKACYWGAAAGAIAVTQSGAQEAMPTREELQQLI
jgi:ribokinase